MRSYFLSTPTSSAIAILPEQQSSPFPELIKYSPTIDIIRHGSELEILNVPLPKTHIKSATQLPMKGFDNPHHSRRETTVVKDVHQSYPFISPLRNYSEDHLSHSCTANKASSTKVTENSFELENRDYCPACKVEVKTTLRYESLPIPLWKQLLCTACYENPGYVSLRCCHRCQIVLTEVKCSAAWS